LCYETAIAMTLDLLSQATFAGPAFTEPFVRYELEHELAARKLLPREAGAEGRELQASWETYRRYLRELVALGGAVRVRNHVLEPLVGRLGYARFEPADDVTTREGQEPGGTLMLDGDDARWAVRAAIDAVVAQAYGLDREQYAHVLSTFSHKSYPNAPALCLARFDELAEVGLDAFTRKWDPYWDVPLNEALPEAVIEIEGAGARDRVSGEQLELEL